MATGSIDNSLERIRKLLLQLKPTGDDGFEGLLATTLSEFSGLTIRLAKSGSQFGRDGRSPSGPFAIAMEAKRHTNELGLEVLAKAAVAGHVLGDSVDVWAVGATSAIGDETLEKVTGLLEEHGVTLLALDWAARPLPQMAVLLSATQNTTIDWLTNRTDYDAAELMTVFDAIASHPSYDAQVVRLRDDVTAAKVGLGALRMRSDEWLSRRLREPLTSQISFGQYLTVAAPHWPAVPRPVLLDQLAQRTTLTLASDRPVVVAVLGPEGVGKSWLVAQWWAGLSERPIMVIVAGRRAEQLSPTEPLEGLARLLSDEVPCSSHDSSGGWLRRLRRWKTQNSTGHLRFVIAVDGLNEQPTRPWADLIKGLANDVHSLGGLVIVTSRSRYWDGSIRPRLPDSLDIRTMQVLQFDDDEIVAALAPAGISPHTLPPKVRDFVRNPRICALAVKVLDRLLLQPGELTVDRLLFEYWRQRVEERGDLTKHTIADFEKLIRSHANAWLERPSRSFDRDEWDCHSGAARRLGPNHVLNDVTDIEEGRFLQISPNNSETYEFRKEALPYALALLVNHELKSSRTGEAPREHLHRILDPVRGFDFVAEVVEASVRLACLDPSFPEETRTALVRAWMGSQNVDYGASDAMSAYVRTCPTPFLRAAALPEDSTQPFIHRDLLLALLMPSRDTQTVQSALSQCLPKWLAQWSRGSRTSFGQEVDAERQARRENRITERLASMTPKEMAFFRGITFEEPDAPAIALDAAATLLVAGRPLAPHVKGIVGWAFARTIAGDLPDNYDSFAWVVRLNPVDSRETHDALRSLIKGIDTSASEWVRSAAGTALRMLGTRESSQAAEEIDPAEPTIRWRRVEGFCNTNPHDPSAPPGSNLDNARDAAKAVNPLDAWSSSSRTLQDSDLEGVTAALARFDPVGIIELLRSIVATAAERTGAAVRSLSWNLVALSPLFDQHAIQAIRAGYNRILSRPAPETPDFQSVASSFVRSLMPHLAAEEQLDLLLTLPEECQLTLKLRDGVRPLPANVLEERLGAAVAAPDHRGLLWILFFAAGSKPELTRRSRSLIATCLAHADAPVRACASECVHQAEDSELDRLMLNSDRAATTADTAYLEQYRDAAEARAIAVSRRLDLIHRLSPRLLGYVAEQLGGQALALFSESIDRIVSSLLKSIDVVLPADLEICVSVSENALPGRYCVNDKSDDPASTDLQSFVADINNPEMARRKFSERQRELNEKAAAYIKEISARNMAEIGAQPPPWGLKEVMRLDPDRIASWLQRVLAAQESQVLRQVCNLAVSLARVYSSHDPVLSSKVFRHFVDCRPILNVHVEPEEIPLYEHALFSSGASEALESLKSRVFAQALNDSDLEMATVAAEVCGAHEWLDRYVEGLLGSWHPADQARSLTILGFRQPNVASERILSGAREPGFLGQVKHFASQNYRRAAWTRHWLECLERAKDPIDFWRYGTLAETICDVRVLRVFPKSIASDLLYVFGTDLYRRMNDKAKERSKKLRQTLFGLKAPETEIAAAVSDWPPSSN